MNICLYKQYIHGSKSGRIHARNTNWLLLGSEMGEVIQECLKEKVKDFLQSCATFIFKKSINSSAFFAGTLDRGL